MPESSVMSANVADMSLYNAVAVGLTLVFRVQGVLAALALLAPTPAGLFGGRGCP